MQVDLPYRDTKPVGAADFYLGINATFRFVKERFGVVGLHSYWTDMGRGYFKPVTEIWRKGGLPAVAGYWRSFFAAEPSSEVEVSEERNQVIVSVKQCPAITHLKKNGRKITPEFCQHCHFVSDAIGAGANIAARVLGGNGRCCQTFLPREGAPPQRLEDIEVCS